MPSFFSWQVETVLFFLAKKEKNGFKKRALKRAFGCGGNRKKRADRVVRPYGCGRRYAVATMHCNCSQSLIRLLRRHLPRRGRHSAAAGTGGQGRPPLQGAVGDQRLQRCIATAPRPSSVCFADTFPGGEGNSLRRGRADRGARPYKSMFDTHWVKILTM